MSTDQRSYPASFSANEPSVRRGLPAECTMTGSAIYEYPITAADEFDAGNNVAGPYRVLFRNINDTNGKPTEGSALFCGVTYHPPGVGVDNAVLLCTATS